MSSLSGILAGHRPPGVYRWSAAFSAQDVAASVRAAGWALAPLDGWAAESRDEVLAAIGVALDFPEYYGANLDALWDCLRDLPGPTVLLWQGWSPFARADERSFAALVGVLADRAGEAGDLTVLLQGDGPDLDPALGVLDLD